MKNKKILITTGILILIGLVFGSNYLFGRKSIQTKMGTTVINSLKTEIIQNGSTTIKGEVTKISGRYLILSLNGETLIISVIEGARVESRISDTLEPKEINFENIKIRDRLKIQLGIDSRGNLIGNFITVLP